MTEPAAKPADATLPAARCGSADGWTEGWWAGAHAVASPNHGPRPEGVAITLVVLHSISLPPGCYGGDEVAQLFTNQLDCDAHPYFDALRGVQVSAHFFVRRDGALLQFVSVDRRAWHAGRSQWRGRDNCNDWSVGIELEGLAGQGFEPAQYATVQALMQALAKRYPVAEVVGHEHIAPGRKDDPGPGFDWLALDATPTWPAALVVAVGPGQNAGPDADPTVG